MPYVFRIHKQNGSAPHASTFTYGWGNTAYLQDDLLGEIVTGQSVGRMGTSIPSIFARPMLFQTAFNTLSPNEYGGNGVNQQLISEVFDMLEFLSQNAGNKKLTTEVWVADAQLSILKASGTPALIRLAEALESHLPKIGNPQSITLFFWEDVNAAGQKDKVLIGGTSQSTLVFTSPNWVRKINENGWKFRRLDGSMMFDTNDIQPLSARNHDFSSMMFKLRKAYDQDFQMQCGGNTGMAKYIWETMTMMGVSVPALSQANFLSEYQPVKNTFAGLIPIVHKQISPASSGYTMRPTSQRYINKIGAGGSAVTVPVPLALNDKGIPGINYVGNSKWSPNFSIDEAMVRTTPFIMDRELPGDMGIKYPFVTTYDFLEDKIIEVPGKIDSERFYTLLKGESKYLLPLKQLFFDFFNIKDLDGVNPHTGRPLVEITSEGADGVAVTINMPITDPTAKFIPLKRVYTKDAIVKMSKAVMVGFFPFYKVIDKPSLDTYAVMLASTDKATLDFYRLDSSEIKHVTVAPMQRTAESAFLHSTRYYEVHNSIDFVEVSSPDAPHAMIIPRMKEVSMGQIHFNFAVDFGTSNTFIAYSKDGGTDIKALSFGDEIDGTRNEKDVQTVYLYQPDTLPMMVDTFQREFMLPTLGKEDSLTGFPIKTAVCEITQFENQPAMKLFGNINVGFKFKNEISSSNIPNAKYFTTLKWALEEDPGSKLKGWRVLAYCKQILWLLKNKALLNGGNDRFTVMLTFPESMIDRSVFYEATTNSGVWIEAARELGLDPNNIFDDSVSESEAPYYMVVSGNDNMLNVDIGGGTTDMFLVRRLDKSGNTLADVEAKYLSVKFAADDLWGDGAGAKINTAGNNGFCQYLEDRIRANGGDISGITRLVEKSSDVMAALFSNEDIFKTSQLIKQNNVLRSVLLLHYTAILYAAARLLNSLDAGIPKIISFTGMGSKYLSLICSQNKRLRDFTAGVLELLTGAKAPVGFTLDTHYLDAKEVTAKGALSKANVKEAYHIPDDSKRSITDLGCESYDHLDYGELRDGNKVNAIRHDARKVFDKFIDFVSSKPYGNLTGKEFELSIPEMLIAQLKATADQSFNNVQGGIDAHHDQRTVTDNLFFWFLKDSLCRLASLYNQSSLSNQKG